MEGGGGGGGKSGDRAGTVRSPAVKRLMREAAEMAEGGGDGEAAAAPLDDNLFEWHFTVRGPRATDFAGGVYHGRILLPEDYPMRPPHIVLLTPNGRFETDRKICLSISGHHPETWQPSWSIRTALLALIAFMPTPGEGTIGSLDYPPAERRTLARKSRGWSCPRCGPIVRLLEPPPPGEEPAAVPTTAPEPVRAPTEPAEASENVRDCIIACLLVSIAIFIYRRLGPIASSATVGDDA